MIEELDVIKIVNNEDKYGIPFGSTGTVLEIYQGTHNVFLVEFTYWIEEEHIVITEVKEKDVELIWKFSTHDFVE